MAETNRERGLREGELRIRPSTATRRRAAISAGAAVGAVLVPVGVLLSLLRQNWSVLLLFLFATVLAAGASFLGQGRNEVFVGPQGIRRVSRDCELIATWASLLGVEVKVPGDRIVVFTLHTSGLLVERQSRGHSNAAEALERHPPEGFDFRLDREAADALIEEIAVRRADLKGLAKWARTSRPT